MTEPLILTPLQADAQLAARHLDPATLNVALNIVAQRAEQLQKSAEAARFAGTNANRHRIQGGLGALGRVLQDLSQALELCQAARTVQSTAEVISRGVVTP